MKQERADGRRCGGGGACGATRAGKLDLEEAQIGVKSAVRRGEPRFGPRGSYGHEQGCPREGGSQIS